MLNPNLAAAWFLGGFLRIWHGESDAAIEHFARAMRLSPLDPETYRMQAGMAAAHLFARRFDAASCAGGQGIQGSAELPAGGRRRRGKPHAGGRPDEGKKAMAQVRKLDPLLRISNLGDWLPIRRAEDLATFADGLRKAGLPE